MNGSTGAAPKEPAVVQLLRAFRPPVDCAKSGVPQERIADTDGLHTLVGVGKVYVPSITSRVRIAYCQPVRHWVEHQALGADPRVAIALKLDTPNIDERQLFEHAGVPIRAINAQPPLSPRTNVPENKKHADYDVIFVSDAGHFIPLERPVEFNRDLATWLQCLD